MSLYFKSEIDAMSSQEICDLLNVLESVINCCDKVIVDSNSLEIHVGKGFVRIPKTCSIYKRVNGWAKSHRKRRLKK